MPPLPAVGERWKEDGKYCTAPGGHASGGHNELWEFGDSTTPMLLKMVKLRESIKPYVAELAQNATAHGSPPMQPLFYQFPDDTRAWQVDDQYLFGTGYLVAPILEMGARNRSVYFPGGADVSWRHLFSGHLYKGGEEVIVPAPLDEIPVFTRA
jgi:alpha-D-xyloside xylohydrolase